MSIVESDGPPSPQFRSHQQTKMAACQTQRSTSTISRKNRGLWTVYLPTNSTLFRDSIKEHDKCHLCGERQTLIHLFVTCSKARLSWFLFSNWWNSKNGDTNTIAKNEIIYGVIDNFARYPGLNLCIIIAKYYLYTASRKEEEFYLDAFMAFLANKIKIEKHKSKSQIKVWESHRSFRWCPKLNNVRY